MKTMYETIWLPASFGGDRVVAIKEPCVHKRDCWGNRRADSKLTHE